MILSRVDIKESIKLGEIIFKPEIEEAQFGEASVDLRMGYQVTKIDPAEGLTISVAGGIEALRKANCWRTVTLNKENEIGRREDHEIQPDEFILVKTFLIPTQAKRNLSSRSGIGGVLSAT